MGLHAYLKNLPHPKSQVQPDEANLLTRKPGGMEGQHTQDVTGELPVIDIRRPNPKRTNHRNVRENDGKRWISAIEYFFGCSTMP